MYGNSLSNCKGHVEESGLQMRTQFLNFTSVSSNGVGAMNNPWYRRYPADFINGTFGMTLEEKGAYSLILT